MTIRPFRCRRGLLPVRHAPGGPPAVWTEEALGAAGRRAARRGGEGEGAGGFKVASEPLVAGGLGRGRGIWRGKGKNRARGSGEIWGRKKRTGPRCVSINSPPRWLRSARALLLRGLLVARALPSHHGYVSPSTSEKFRFIRFRLSSLTLKDKGSQIFKTYIFFVNGLRSR